MWWYISTQRTWWNHLCLFPFQNLIRFPITQIGMHGALIWFCMCLTRCAVTSFPGLQQRDDISEFGMLPTRKIPFRYLYHSPLMERSGKYSHELCCSVERASERYRLSPRLHVVSLPSVTVITAQMHITLNYWSPNRSSDPQILDFWSPDRPDRCFPPIEQCPNNQGFYYWKKCISRLVLLLKVGLQHYVSNDSWLFCDYWLISPSFYKILTPFATQNFSTMLIQPILISPPMCIDTISNGLMLMVFALVLTCFAKIWVSFFYLGNL